MTVSYISTLLTLLNKCNGTFINFENIFQGVRPYFEEVHLQSWTFAYIWLLNKPYVNEVTLTGQNPPLKCCQPLELLTQLNRGIDL